MKLPRSARRAPWLALALLAACRSEHPIGSTCEEGVCQVDTPGVAIPCLIETSKAYPSGSTADGDLCIDYEFELAAGMAPCRAYLAYPEAAQLCDELALPIYEDDSPSTPPECELPQLEPDARDPTGETLTGWYLEGPVLPSEECWSNGRFRLRFNGELPEGVEARLSCTTALAHFSDVALGQRRGELPVDVSIDSCGGLSAQLQANDDVGYRCRTRVAPQAGWEYGKSYVDARSDQCSSGVCLVDTLSAPSFDPCNGVGMCASQLAFDEATYCSCRCDTRGDPSPAPCQCPSGYACREVLHGEVPDSLAGGYCVRE